MKAIFGAAVLATIPVFATPPASKPAPCPSCDKGISRAAALTAPADCLKGGLDATFAVNGMEKEGLTTGVRDALAGIEGVHIEKVCPQSAVVKVNYDPAKTSPSKVATTISGTGANVEGQRLTFKIAGMTCSGCSGKLTKVLAKTDGVTKVASVSHEKGNATLLIDPAKTDQEKITGVINKVGYKVVES